MNTIRVALFVATLFAVGGVHANAPVVTSVTVQQGRIEGQNVAVTADVDFGDRIVGGPLRNPAFANIPCLASPPNVPKGSPLGKSTTCTKQPPTPERPLKLFTDVVTRVVTAELLSSDQTTTTGLVSDPIIVTTIPLSFNGSGYTGQFPYLPFDKYTVRVTASEEKHRCQTFGTPFLRQCSAPVTTQNTKISTPFDVLPPATGCFQFKRDAASNPTGLDGWTISGIFDGLNQFPPPPNSNVPTAWLDQDGFLSVANDQDGALVLNTQQSFFPPSNFPSGTWRVDFLSPDLSANPDWQNATGMTLRMLHSFASAPFLQVRPALRVDDANHAETFRRQLSGPTTEDFLTVGPQPYRIIVASFPLSAGDTVKQIVISVFGSLVGAGDGFVALDGVCPKH